MKKKVFNLVIVLVFSISILGCKITYQNAYTTYLEGSPTESLVFEDSIIKISFDPKPNGILFDIENLTSNNLYLIWDKSYFIEPSGNTTKLLNTDLLETSSIIRDKENYESIIPQRAHFKRFTCSATNISQFSTYNASTIYNEATKTIISTADYSKFYLTGIYWYSGSKRQFSSKIEIPNLDKQEIAAVQKFVHNNDNLGLGITLRNRDKEMEYHFKFPIKNVIISKKTPEVNETVVFIESYILQRNNSFNAVSLGDNEKK